MQDYGCSRATVSKALSELAARGLVVRRRRAGTFVAQPKAHAAFLAIPDLGAEVTELIQGYVVAMNLETTEEELMHTVFPHPTLSEMMHESVLDAYGRVIHT